MSKMIIRIPRRNIYSTIVSSRFSIISFLVWIEENEKIHEKIRSITTMEVNSSRISVSVLLAISNEVITKRQNPSRFADVVKMC